jgi:hypothetical protein
VFDKHVRVVDNPAEVPHSGLGIVRMPRNVSGGLTVTQAKVVALFHRTSLGRT